MTDNGKVQTTNNGGIGILGATFLLLMGLKLGGVISISWWLVTAPLWGPFALLLGGVVIYFAVAALIGVFTLK